MKNSMLRATAICVAAALFLLSGCNIPGLSLSSRPSPESASADVFDSDSGQGGNGGADPSSAPSSESTASEQSPDSPVDCNWTLYVDQTIPVTVQGMTINYTLLLVAQKSGGKDVNGTYTGAAYLGMNFDASQMSNSFMEALGGFNVDMYTTDMSFDVVAYDQQTFSEYGSDADLPLAELLSYQAMALVSPVMTGTGTLNPSVSGAQGEQGGLDISESGSASVPMKISIESGQVSVSIPSLKITERFKGTLTGEPVGSAGSEDIITQAIEQINTLMDQAKAEDDEAAGG